MRRLGETRRIVIFAAAIAAVLVVGTVGFMVIEGLSFVDALYMTVTSLTTVGFGEVKPFSVAGRLFVIVLVIGGVSVVAYGLTSMLQFVVDGQLTGLYRRRAMKKRIEAMRDHFIICGHGRVGEAVAKEFALARRRLRRRRPGPRGGGAGVRTRATWPSRATPRTTRCCMQTGHRPRPGTGRGAGLGRVQHVRHPLGPGAQSQAHAGGPRQLRRTPSSKLRRAGADQVISPYSISGRKMAHLLLASVGQRLPGRDDRRRRDRVPTGGVRAQRDLRGGGAFDPRPRHPPAYGRVDPGGAAGRRAASTPTRAPSWCSTRPTR